MRLDYNILWLEDSTSWLSQTIPSIESIVEDNSYIPKIESISANFNNTNYLKSHLSSNEYDLILMDYDLAGSRGDDLIDIIRGMEIFTDIIFYSQVGIDKLMKYVFNKKLEGIYFANRNNGLFENKVEKLIRKTIIRNLLPNNFRGLLMNESCEIELSINDIIVRFINGITGDEKIIIRDEIYDMVYKNSKSRLANKTIFNSTDISELTKDSNFKAKQKIAILNNFVGNKLDYFNNDSLFSTIDSDIFSLRNDMGHERIRLCPTTKQYFYYKGGKIYLNETYIKTARNKIIDHKLNFK